MRWNGQQIDADEPGTLPGLGRLSGLVRSVTSPDFAGATFHEVVAKSALNRVVGAAALPFGWTVNPYRGCTHACVYCFARPTHRYLDLDAGADFDREIVVKVNVAEVLRAELARPGWVRHPVALGTNTDPYQRAEGRYGLMPGVIAALADSGTPFSVLTKGTLLRRDLGLLARAAETVPVELAMSIAVLDDELQPLLEPGAPTFRARLETIRAAREAGFAPAVFLMPVLPWLTDSVDALEDALTRIAASGAASVTWGALHLKPGVREWFMAWLDRERPDLVAGYRRLYVDGPAAAIGYRRWLSARVLPIARRHGLVRTRLAGATGTARVRSGPRGSASVPRGSATVAGRAEPDASRSEVRPTLF